MSRMQASVLAAYPCWAICGRDRRRRKEPLDGSNICRLRLPPNIPAKDFWSPVFYDNQTRSMLQIDQQLPSLGSDKKDLVINPASAVDAWFGPTLTRSR